VEAIRILIDQANADKAQTAQIEQKLDAVLDDPAATFAGKQEAARFLWIVGSARSVPTLAKMLGDEKLSDVARYALERNPDPAAGKALRAGLATTGGKTQLGLINSIGNRGDMEAVSALKPFATSQDAQVSEVTITALGKIGTQNALSVLHGLPAENPRVGHAMLQCAEHFAATGKKAEAQRVFEGLVGEKYPSVTRVEALRGLANTGSPHAATTILGALKSSDSYVQQAAAHLAGSFADAKTTAQVVALWPSLPAPTQGVLLIALADRREPAVMPLALTATQSRDVAMRVTGIQALTRLSGVGAVARLADIALHSTDVDRAAALEGLASVSGADADEAILKMARQGTPESRTVMLSILAERPSPAVMTVLIESARDSDSYVASEAVRGLGRLGGAQYGGELVKILVSTKIDDVRYMARDSIVLVYQKSEDADRSHILDLVFGALNSASSLGKASLLPILAQTGGDRSLSELTHATSSGDPEVKQAAVTALSDTWSDARALPILLNLAKTDSDKAVRVQSLRGYVRLIGQDDQIPPAQKAQGLAVAIGAAERPDEKQQALSVLRDCRVPQAMEVTARLLDDPDLFTEASATVLYLAAPQRRNNRDLPAVKGEATNAALNKVIQKTKDAAQRDQARKLLG
jgi:HEAT repeat protein